ncbi:MAG: tetratricopeptide repeat protein [Pseudomonadota bacterium]
MFSARRTKFVQIAAAALLVTTSPALALSSAEAEAFEAEISLAKSNMMGQSATALKHARKARSLVASESVKAEKARLTAKWLEAEALMRMNRAGDAAPILGEAVAETAKRFKGTKLHADLLRSQGSLHARSGEFAAALPAFKMAQSYYAELGEARSQAIVLLNIGSLYSGARDFEAALGYFQKGHEAFPDDPSLGLSAHNNIGNALKGLGRYDEAEIAFAKALSIAKQKPSAMLEARILTNIASAQTLGGKVQEAEETAKEAMAIAKEHAPDWARFIDGVLAQIELSKGNMDEAETLLDRAFKDEDLSKTAAHFREFHETAVQLYSALGQEAQLQKHSAALERLNAQVASLTSA